jgi:selenocysteine lyase/cysteine desulfurase
MAETRHLSTLDIINEFPGVCGSVYLNTAAEGLFMRSHGAALQRYAELKQMGARGRDGCLAIEWRARELAATLLGVDPQNIAFLASTARGLDVAIKSIGWRDGDNIVLPDSEFPTTAFAAVHLSRIGVERRIVPSHDGRIRLDELARWVDRRTRLVPVHSDHDSLSEGSG